MAALDGAATCSAALRMCSVVSTELPLPLPPNPATQSCLPARMWAEVEASLDGSRCAQGGPCRNQKYPPNIPPGPPALRSVHALIGTLNLSYNQPARPANLAATLIPSHDRHNPTRPRTVKRGGTVLPMGSSSA